MDNINNETEALRACSEEFIADIQREYGLDIHHVEVTLRKNSCIRAETANGDSKVVPALNIYFLDESFSKVIDDRKQLKTDMTDKIRKMWQEATIPYRQYLNKKECCDPHMYIHASDFEQKCFYDFVSGRQKEIVELLNSRLGAGPKEFIRRWKESSLYIRKLIMRRWKLKPKQRVCGKRSMLWQTDTCAKNINRRSTMFHISASCIPKCRDITGMVCGWDKTMGRTSRFFV